MIGSEGEITMPNHPLPTDAALLIVDVQNDFCPGGALAVPEGDAVVAPLNRFLAERRVRPVYASRDWHPRKTRHFAEFGGQWPVHCVQFTHGAEFHPALQLPPDTVIISKGMDPERDDYSALAGVDSVGWNFAERLRRDGVGHLYVGGLALEYCVRCTVLDLLAAGFQVTLLPEATQALSSRARADALEQIVTAGAFVEPNPL